MVAWLNDAYAIEQALIPILQNYAKDVETEMPGAVGRIRQDIEETRTHGERVAEWLRELGESSSVKSVLSSVFGAVHSVTTGLFSDEALKNGLSDCAVEHFEVVCYRALAEAVRELGHQGLAVRCEQNMREDAAMAQWLNDQLPNIVKPTMLAKGAERSR